MPPLLRSLFALLFAIVWSAVPATQLRPVRIHFIDVGQGDAVFIQGPAGEGVLYDGGKDPLRVRDYLARQGVTSLDLVIASHNDEDHIGGLEAVVARFRPRMYIVNDLATTTPPYVRFREALTAAGSQKIPPEVGRLTIGGLSLRPVPPPRIPEWGSNENSVGAFLEWGEFRLFLGGDAAVREWTWWLVHYPDVFRAVAVTKSSHHGSRIGDVDGGLQRLAPAHIVISVGRDNPDGHPHAEALELYARHGAKVFRTDHSGTIVIEADRSGRYDVVTVPRWTLSGVVRDAVAGTPLSGVTVSVTDGPNAGRATTTDAAGSYTLAFLEQSGFTVRFTRADYDTLLAGVTLTGDAARDVSLRPVAPPSARLFGTVTDAQTGARLSGVTVRATSSGGTSRTATTDASGTYSIGDVQHGQLVVTFSRSGYESVEHRVAFTQDGHVDAALRRTPPPQPELAVIRPEESGTTVCRQGVGQEPVSFGVPWVRLERDTGNIGLGGSAALTARPVGPRAETVTLRWWLSGRYGRLLAAGCEATYVGPNSIGTASQVSVQIHVAKEGNRRTASTFTGEGSVRVNIYDHRNLPQPCAGATVTVATSSARPGLLSVRLQGVGEWDASGSRSFTLPVRVRQGRYTLTVRFSNGTSYQRDISVGCPTTSVYLD